MAQFLSLGDFINAAFLGTCQRAESILFAHDSAATINNQSSLDAPRLVHASFMEGRSGEFHGNLRFVLRTSSATGPDA
jgi:hypothetical protein